MAQEHNQQGLPTIKEMQEALNKKEDSIHNPKDENLNNIENIRKQTMNYTKDNSEWIDDNKASPSKSATEAANMQAKSMQALEKVADSTPKEMQVDSKKANLKQESNDLDMELKQEKYQQIVAANPVGKQETWLLLDEFVHLSGLDRDKVEELIRDKTIKSKVNNGKIYIEASTGTSALIKKVENRLVSLDMSGNALDPVFVEKTIATILGLHEKVISSKDETISAFKSENSFLKESLISMQEIYDDDKKTIELLRQQLQKAQEEVEFVKRKYKLMWGRVSNSAT